MRNAPLKGADSLSAPDPESHTSRHRPLVCLEYPGLARLSRTCVALFFLFSPAVLWAPPVPVPDLTTPGFQSSDLDPFFQAAASEQSEAQWLAAVNDGLGVIAADWEAAVDQQIETLVGQARAQYAGMTAQEEQDLRDALIQQKQTIQLSWEASADLEIERRHERYIQELVSETVRELPLVLENPDASGLDTYLQEAANDAYTLSDWEQIVDEGLFSVSSTWEAIAIPALQQAADEQAAQAVADGTIESSTATELFSAELLELLTSVSVGQGFA